MALPTASDNVFPKVILAEGSAPATPAAGTVVVYAKTDGNAYQKDDAGTETGLAGGVGGGGEFTEISTLKLTGGGADINTTSTSFVDLTGASITMTTAAVRCLVIVSLMAINSNAGQSVCFDVDIDGTRFANTTNGIARMVGTTWTPIQFQFFTDVLSAASHTFKIQWRVSANTGGVANQTTTSPIIFQVVETSMTA